MLEFLSHENRLDLSAVLSNSLDSVFKWLACKNPLSGGLIDIDWKVPLYYVTDDVEVSASVFVQNPFEKANMTKMQMFCL